MSDIHDNISNHTLENELASFGISTLEATVYLHLLNNGSKTMLELAQELGVPRTSIYDNALKLSEKGLIQRVITFKSQKLKAYPLEILRVYVEDAKARAEALEVKLDSLEKKLSRPETSFPETEARYYKGVSGIRQMIWNNLQANKEILSYSQFGLLEIVGVRFAEKHAQELARKGISSRVLVNPASVNKYRELKLSAVSAYRKTLQECRISENLYISGDTMIYNDIFAVVYWLQNEYVGVEIKNAELVKSQQSIFDLLWKNEGKGNTRLQA